MGSAFRKFNLEVVRDGLEWREVGDRAKIRRLLSHVVCEVKKAASKVGSVVVCLGCYGKTTA